MKNAIYFLFIFLTANTFAQYGWYAQQSGTNVNLSAVHFINPDSGIVVGGNGTILQTSNGGATWNKLTSGTNENLSNIAQLDTNKIIVIGNNGTILRTSNGGKEWIKNKIEGATYLSGISFMNDDTGIIVGHSLDSTIILNTTDGGITWNLNPHVGIGPSRFAGQYVLYQDSNNIITLGVKSSYQGIYQYTSKDGGKTWSGKGLDGLTPNGGFAGASFENSQVGMYAGWRSMTSQVTAFILKTVNGGVSWGQVVSLNYPILAINCTSPGICTFLAQGGKIFHSNDGGVNWIEQKSGTTNRLYSVFFSDAMNGTFVGEKGTILHTITGGFTVYVKIVYPDNGRVLHAGDYQVLKMEGNYRGSMKLELTTDNGKSWRFIDSLNSLNWGQDYTTDALWSHNYGWKVPNIFSDSCKFKLTGNEIPVIGESSVFLTAGASIQGLIDNSQPGDTVFLNDLEYWECLDIEKPVTLIGKGIDQTKIIGDTLKPVIIIKSDNVVIKNLTVYAVDKNSVDNNRINCSTNLPTNGMEIINSANIVLDNVQIYGGKDISPHYFISGGVGLIVKDSKDINISNSKILGADAKDFNTSSCSVENGGIGLKIISSDLVNISNCEISGGKGGNGYSTFGGSTEGGFGGNSTYLVGASEIVITNSHLIGGIGGKAAGTNSSYPFRAKAGDGIYCDSCDVLFLNSVLEGGNALVSSDGVPNTFGGNGITAVNNSLIAIDGGNLVRGLSSEDANGELYYFDLSSKVTFKNLDSHEFPIAFLLEQNYPNPFNLTTTIRYSVPEHTNVTLKIFDLLGREVATLVNEEKQTGFYNVKFDGSSLASGIYFYRIEATPFGGQAGNFIQAKKLVLLK